MKCANCNKPAEYTVVHIAARPAHYCASCLPPHYRAKAAAGELPLLTPAAPKPAPKSRKKAKNEDIPGTSEASASDPVESDDAEGPVS